jgi:hypothetical protein
MSDIQDEAYSEAMAEIAELKRHLRIAATTLEVFVDQIDTDGTEAPDTRELIEILRKAASD